MPSKVRMAGRLFGSNCLRGDVALDYFQQGVEDQRVRLLNAASIIIGDDDFKIGPAFGFAAAFTQQRD